MKSAEVQCVSRAGELDRFGDEGLARLLRTADALGIDAAMREALARDAGLLPSFRITGRADWRFHLPEHGRQCAVVLGSGLGGTAFDLSEDYHDVASCERTPEALAWQEHVVSAGSFPNVRVVPAHQESVPLPDGCADLVALERGFVEAAAGSAVREARRLLKDGGWLYWGVETRPGWPLPRPHGGGGTGCLLTPSEVERLLLREGLADVALFWVRPDLEAQHSSGWMGDRRTFIEHVRARRTRRLTDTIKNAGLEFAGQTGIYRRLLPHVLVFARKNASGQSGVVTRPVKPPQPAFVTDVERLLAERGKRVQGLTAVLVQANYNASGRLTYLLFERKRSRPSFIVKLARNRRSREALTTEARAFESLHSRSEFLRRGRERVYYRGEGCAFVLEDFLVGGTVGARQGVTAYEDRAIDWLLRFQAAAAGRHLGKRELKERLERLGEATGFEPFRQLAADTARRVEAIGNFEVSEVPVHGDFTDDNILLDGEGVYVVDWEWLRPGGWPLEDLFWFFIVRARGIPGTFAEAGSARVLDAMTGRSPGARRIRDVARRFASARGVPAGLVPVFVIVTLLEMTLRWKDAGRIDWQSASTADYEKALRALIVRQAEFWEWWGGR